MKKVVLYGLFNPAVVNLFRERFQGKFEIIEDAEQQNLQPLRDAEYIINRVFPMDRALFDQAKNLMLVQKWGSGTDKLDIAYAGELGIPVVNCAGINALPVAEMAVLLMLASYRHIIPQAERFKNGEWPRDEYARKSYLLHGKTVGLLGFGRIGQQVGKVLHEGFGCEIQYYDAFRLPPEREAELGVRYADRDTLARTSDIISLHMPLMEATRGTVNGDFFKMMKPSAILINTARGGIVDEPALIEALRSGKIAGAGLDTFSVEPYPATSPLLQLENVVATPHCAGNTADNDVRMAGCCIESILSFDGGTWPEPPQLVNSQFIRK